MTAVMAPKFAVYRLFDADGHLLYVGSTTDAGRRIGEHRRQKSWGADIARVRIQVFATCEAMALAERAVIDSEQPVHNRMRYLPSDRLTQQGVGKTPKCGIRMSDEDWERLRWVAERRGRRSVMFCGRGLSVSIGSRSDASSAKGVDDASS